MLQWSKADEFRSHLLDPHRFLTHQQSAASDLFRGDR